MPKYEKWLGAGLGWLLAGNPLGGLLGFIAGTLVEQNDSTRPKAAPTSVSEFEMNLMVLSAHLIKIDGYAGIDEISFALNFFNAHFDERHSSERTQILNHCLQREYDLNISCTQLRHHTQHGTKIQIIHFLFDLANSDGPLNERERYFIFKIAGFLNINDVEFKKIASEHQQRSVSVYEVLGIAEQATVAEIRTAYRKMVLKYHPDRHKTASEKERKELALKFQRVQEAYITIKQQRGM